MKKEQETTVVTITQFVKVDDRKYTIDNMDDFLEEGGIRDFYFRYQNQNGEKSHSQRIIKVDLIKKEIITADNRIYKFLNEHSNRPFFKRK